MTDYLRGSKRKERKKDLIRALKSTYFKIFERRKLASFKDI